jgi:FkbM family methyltransferase
MIPSWNPELLVDVGANIGQTALELHGRFPRSIIHSFEPVSGTFARLRDNVEGIAAIQCHNFALGAESGKKNIHVVEESLVSSFRENPFVIGSNVESVNIDTLDSFAEREGIQRIGLLKIDAEGFDLEVLKGASRLLAKGAIEVINVEASVGVSEVHCSTAEITEYLREFEFLPIGFYDQAFLKTRRMQFGNLFLVAASMLK